MIPSMTCSMFILLVINKFFYDYKKSEMLSNINSEFALNWDMRSYIPLKQGIQISKQIILIILYFITK